MVDARQRLRAWNGISPPQLDEGPMSNRRIVPLRVGSVAQKRMSGQYTLTPVGRMTTSCARMRTKRKHIGPVRNSGKLILVNIGG